MALPREGYGSTRFVRYQWVRRLVSVAAVGLLTIGTLAATPAYAERPPAYAEKLPAYGEAAYGEKPSAYDEKSADKPSRDGEKLPPDPKESPAERTFTSLEEAVEAGAIDPITVVALRKGKKVEAFAILESDKVLDAYGTGEKDGVARAAELVKGIRDTVLARHDLTAIWSYDLVPVALVPLRDEASVLRLLNDDLVRSIAADYKNQLWLEDSLPLIRQPALAASGVDGRGVTVVTIDTGADLTQPEFGMCTAPGVPATCRVPVMMDTAPDDGAVDDNGHGTNTSAIAAGVAPGAQIVPIDAFAGGGIMDHDAIAAIDWVLANRAARNIRAVNMSFGRGEHYNTTCGGGWFSRNPYQQSFQMLRAGGVLPVLSAGNAATVGGSYVDGIGYPACTLGAVAVGATYPVMSTDKVMFSSCTDPGPIVVDQVACFSQGGDLLDVVAPGVFIDAAGIQMSGTSQAAPHVAGAAAVLAQVRPSSTSDDLRSFLRTSHTTVLDPRGGRFHPRLDLTDAVRAAAPVPNDNRASATVLAAAGGRTAQTTWTATKESGEPDHAGNAGGASVWFRWTATYTGPATFTTDGSDFDTLLGVYQANGTLLGANDNVGAALTSAVTVPVSTGDTILIAVDGVRPVGGVFAGTGQARLTWNLRNDQIADAIALPSLITINGVGVSGSNVAATHEFGEPHHCGDQFSTASVWYRYTASTTQTIRLRASGVQPLCVAVYQAAATIALPSFAQLTWSAAGADDQGYPIDFDFEAVAGNSYWIAVDGVSMEYACNPSGQCFYHTSMGQFGFQLN